MKKRKIIGWLMLSCVFAAVFGFTVVLGGWKLATLVWLGVAGLVFALERGLNFILE